MLVGLFGGSFNPPHQGHQLVADIALRRLGLDQLWWMVTPGNPLKSRRVLAPLAERLDLSEAMAHDPRIRVTAFEKSLNSSYTAEVLARVKARNPAVAIALADPAGSALASYVNTGELKAEGGSISEGIGSSRVTANFDGAPVDLAWSIPDSESVPWVHALMHGEGINAGGSSGVNVAGAVRLAAALGPGHTIVTVLADAGTRYQGKLYNPAFLRSRDLPVPEWLARAFPE